MYKVLLAIRYLLKRRISYFALFSVALCVFVVLVVMTVLNGLTSEFKEKTHRTTGDCVIASKSLAGFPYYQELIAELEKEEIVEAVSPVIKTYGVVKTYITLLSPEEQTLKIIGIDPELQQRVADFSDFLYYRDTADFNNIFSSRQDSNMPACIAGILVLYRRDKSGNYDAPQQLPAGQISITCFPLSAKGTLLRAATDVIASKTFILGNLIVTNSSADWENIYISFDYAQILSGLVEEPKRVSSLHIKFRKDVEIAAGIKRINSLWNRFIEQKKGADFANLFKTVRVESWKDYNRQTVAVAETQQALMILVFILLGVITVFIAFVVFFMIVNHKSKDIGILKSVGVSNSGMMSVFVLFAFLTGLIGSIIGSFLGWLFLAYINQIENWLYIHYEFQLWDRSMYLIGKLPNSIDLRVLLCIILSAIAACLIGVIVPASQAARLDPVKQLQVARL